MKHALLGLALSAALSSAMAMSSDSVGTFVAIDDGGQPTEKILRVSQTPVGWKFEDRQPDGSWLDAAATLARGSVHDDRFRDLTGRSTTLCVVATNAALDRAALAALARAASAALYRRITPVATQFDGDVIFATAPTSNGIDASIPQIEALAVQALETAIERSVRAAAPGDILKP